MSDDEGGVQLSGDYNANDEEKEFMPVENNLSSSNFDPLNRIEIKMLDQGEYE